MASNRTRRLALASLFAVLIFVSLGFLPTVTADYFIGIEVFFLALAFLVLGFGGATYVGVVTGLLFTAVSVSPLDLLFATFFGIMVDILAVALRAKKGQSVSMPRFVAATTIATGVVGYIVYYVAAVLTNLVPNQFILDATVLIFGVASGAIGGFLAVRVWKRYLSARY